MEQFVKQYPAVILAYCSIITTLLMGLISWAVTSTTNAIKEDLKDVKTKVEDHGERIANLEGGCKARHGGVDTG